MNMIPKRIGDTDMMAFKKDPDGTRSCIFDDANRSPCRVLQSPGAFMHTIVMGVLDQRPMQLTQEHAAQLIPILQHFVKTGELPDGASVSIIEEEEKPMALSDPFDEESELEDMEDYKKFQRPDMELMLPDLSKPPRGFVPQGFSQHDPMDADDLLPDNDRPFPGTPTGRLNYSDPPGPQDLPREDGAADQSPGARAFSAKVALVHRLNDTVYRFTEEDLADFREMHRILDRIHKRHEGDAPRRQDHGSPDW